MNWSEVAITVLVLFVCADQTRALTVPALKMYGADSTKVSVSGVSSGANMAVQLHVAYSSSIMGVGSVAGGPYYCAEGSSSAALIGRCSALGDADDIVVQDLIDKTTAYDSANKVDPTSNLSSARVYIFSGTYDLVVPTDVVEKLQDYYEHYITTAGNIMTKYDLAAGHGFITTNYINSCQNSYLKPNINDCDYNQAYEILNHIYGNLVEPDANTIASGQLLKFDQRVFFPSAWNGWWWHLYRAMDDSGSIYVPSGCESTTGCKLHVALHGCAQSTDTIDEQYSEHTGYNEVGELNNIIILYPVARPNTYIYKYNPLGCWDWWGYTNSNYATNQGSEMNVIKQLIDRVLQSP